ncbi:sigma-70 family RNA polymerase sigma factor [Saccharothrix sp. CCNWLY140-2]|uniref:RNA polymerase sigma factor n=1 Tax=Saccharothrix sp. CCNWLY140-2 TaxID=3138500 RepID=UPI00321688A1
MRLRDALVAENCDGPVWQRFAATLAEYGYAVVMAWLRSGAIFSLCAEKRCAVGDPPPYWEHDDLVSLTTDTVIGAIRDFRTKALLDGGWDPDGGAGLKTYFATACVYAFPNVYRRWQTEFNRRLAESSFSVREDDLVDVSSTAPDPSDVVVTRLEVKRRLADIGDERAKRALILREAGYTIGEIAEVLGTSHGAIKGALERLRRTLGEATGNGGGDV